MSEVFYFFRGERPSHDVADVLLSIKHSGVLKPNQEIQQTPLNHTQTYQPQASLSYTVHPQMLVSSGNHQTQSQNGSFPTSSYYEPGPCSMQHPPLYPSMSVNVSMNMTMHGYAGGPEVPVQCSQMQWPPQNTGSSVNVLYPPLLSPGAYPNGATYSFTADFRPQTTNQSALAIDSHKMSSSPTKQFYQANIPYPIPSQSPPICQSQQLGVKIKSPKELKYEEEDSGDGLFTGDSKQNLCRLCGKCYARPSTLKTHLRTHSGERPYR